MYRYSTRCFRSSLQGDRECFALYSHCVGWGDFQLVNLEFYGRVSSAGLLHKKTLELISAGFHLRSVVSVELDHGQWIISPQRRSNPLPNVQFI